MKRTLLTSLIVSMCCAGCASVATQNQRAITFTEALEASQDPIETIEAYINKYKKCETRTNYTTNNDLVSAIIESNRNKERCVLKQALAQPGTKFDCMNKGHKDYRSDDCILYRRNTPESSVDYFDYARFLPTGSPIKTDDDFATLVEYYKSQDECDKMTERTTEEKQACKDSIIANIRLIATQTASCMTAHKQEYKNKLTEVFDWYIWAIDHDPNAAAKFYESAGVFGYSQYLYQPVYSPSEAKKEVKSRLQKFGKEHLCSTDNYEQDLKSMGYRL